MTMKKLEKALPTGGLFSRKLGVVGFLVAALFGVAVLRMTDIIGDDSYIALKKYKTMSLRNTESVIMTSTDGVLAMNNRSKDLYLNTKHIEKKKIKLFLTILENNTSVKFEKEERARITREVKTKGRLLVKRGLDNIEVDEIKATYSLLKKMGFLKYYTTSDGKRYLYGPEFDKSTKGMRVYSKNNRLYQPFIGLVDSSNKGRFGLERYLERYVSNNLNIIKKTRSGVKLISNENILDDLGSARKISISLTLDDRLQKRLRDIIAKKNKTIGAENILASVVEVDTGNIVGLSQLNAFDANNIMQEDVKNMKDFYTNYLYEVGSVIKPITLSIAMEHGLVDSLEEEIDTSNGYMYIGRKRITDEHRAKSMTVKEVISQSSNVGISRIALRMNNNEFYEGLGEYGLFTEKNNLETVNGRKQYFFRGEFVRALKNNKMIQRATGSYGYGFMITPYNLQRMYNVIFNNGKVLDFNMVRGNAGVISKDPVLSPGTVAGVVEALESVVQEGTGVGTKFPGFKIYGKTGTSHIASRSGKYENQYHATFVGCVEDKNHKKYNILVTVVKPKRSHRFASLSAVPIFKSIVKELLFEDKIKIDL